MTDVFVLILCAIGFAWSGYHMAYASKCQHPSFNVMSQRCTWCGKGMRTAFFDGYRNFKHSDRRDPFGECRSHIVVAVEPLGDGRYRQEEYIAADAPPRIKELFHEMKRRQNGGWF